MKLNHILSGATALLFLVLLFSCNLFNKNKTSPMTINGDYDKAWHEVDSLDQQSLPKSALEKVNAIAARARSENNTEQLVKAIIFQGKYTVALEEDGLVKAIQLFEQEEKTATGAPKAILQSMLGQLYGTYLNNMGWQLRNRTPIPAGESGDILTWSAAQLEENAVQRYLQSVENPEMLAAISLEKIPELVIKGAQDSVSNKALRPTLLDFLSHRAIEYLSNERSYLTQPVYAFRLDNPVAFALPEEFAKATFATQDSSSGKWLTLGLYQRLTKYHLAQNNKEALVDLTLSRLQFAKDNFLPSTPAATWEEALNKLLNKYEGAENASEIIYKQALSARSAGEKGDNVKAVALAEKAIQKYPGSFGARQAAVLIATIKRPSLSIKVEEYMAPNQAILVSMGYANLEVAYYKLLKLKWEDNELRIDDLKASINKAAEIKSGTFAVKNPGDYRSHHTEVMLNGLPVGRYLLLVSDKADSMTDEESMRDYATFSCTNMATLKIPVKTEGTDFAVVNRLTGAPMAGIKGEVIQQYWDNGRNRTKVIEKVTTDQNGRVKTGILPENRSSRVVFKNGEDQISSSYFSNYRDRSDYRENGQVEFFTDRTLYRPGQTLYFKGIALKKDEKNRPSILANQKMEVVLLDANGQEKSKLSLTTNEYGTVNGSFVLPQGGLTGTFSLEVRSGKLSGDKYVNVEEYKRPKFEVTFKPVEGAFKLNEKVTVTGEAMNYAGNPTDGAMVKWRVTREAYFPYWSYKRYWPGGGAASQEIAFGEATTDVDGKFSISFTTLPDDNPESEQSTYFRYAISAEVTDAVGETRSSNTEVMAGKKSFVTGNDLDGEVELDSLKNVAVFAKNLAGQAVAAKGNISLQKLVGGTKLFRRRYFEMPDIWSMSKAEFEQNFPNYAWENEEDPTKWTVTGAAVKKSFDAEKDKTIDLSTLKLEPAYYKIITTATGSNGETVTDEKIVRIKANAADFIQPGSSPEQAVIHPGQAAEYTIGSAAPQLYVLLTQQHGANNDAGTWKNIAGKSSFSELIKEDDRGNAYTHWITVYDNREYSGTIAWDVPWDNKQLEITFETFRDKLQPGSAEEWRLRVSGPGKEKIAAELVASMYDASLDQFAPFKWDFSPYPTNYNTQRPNGDWFGNVNGQNIYSGYYDESAENLYRTYPSLNWYEFPFYGPRVMYDMAVMSAAPSGAPGGSVRRKSVQSALGNKTEGVALEREEGDGFADSTAAGGENPSEPAPYPASIRSNLNETVFFFPELHTDANGDVLVKFKMNEALTRWKFQVLAHTKDLKFGLAEKTVVTQKDVMITANAPRFLRAGDEIEFSAKISNLTDAAISGKASLALLDAATLKPLERDFNFTERVVDFNIPAKQSGPALWKIKIPVDYTGAVTWQVFADSKAGRDGEESTIPVITNRMLVTESLPLAVRGGQDKTFRFEPLKPSDTRKMERYTLEFTSNPVWYAVQSLPYLMEYPHECSEQVFSRYYANTLASSVTQKMPAIKRVYERWKGTEALKSNLSKNQDLKYALLEETPWVMDAQSEEQQKQQIALLFDLNRMSDEENRALSTLSQRQSPNGGWSWFPGGKESWYITQHIVCGLQHLDRLQAIDLKKDGLQQQMRNRGMQFCEQEAEQEYNELEKLVKKGKASWDDDHLSDLMVHYMYARSFQPELKDNTVSLYYKKQIRKFWASKNIYQQGMMALILHRSDDAVTAGAIVKSLKERATIKEELGMYWPNQWGMYWYQLPIETQALMVEVFNEVANDRTSVDNLRIWLLKNKQTNRWESTKATAEAVYALLLNGDNWLENTQPVQVSLGKTKIDTKASEPGTGYFKQSWTGSEIKSEWEEVSVKNPNSSIAWGSAYRQYFEDIDKVTGLNNTGLKIGRQIFIKTNSAKGPVLTAVPDGGTVKVGDQLVVRIEITTDRAMEFVHFKDMRAAGSEPKNVLSGYRYQDGLGYYESTRDLATHFFFDYLPRGTHVLEYPLAATHRGDMSFGISTLQCMYAPEFTGHSSGIRIKIK